MTLHPIPRSLSRAGFLTEPTPAARRNVFMDPAYIEDMLAHASASFSLQLQKQDRVSISANAMREMLDELMTGDVSVIDDTPVMRMPDGYMTREYGEWVAIVPALEGWVDCMQRIVPDLSSGAIVDLAGLLRAGEEITPELVMVARIQLEDQIQAMKRMPIGAINAAVESTKSDWRKEEKLKEEMTMNARDKATALPAIDGTINAAHGLLMAATDALSADQVAAMLKTTKKAATAQLKELQGLGFLESELRKGGTRYFRLVVVTEAKPGIPVVADDGCGACGDACASNGGDCRVKEESPPVPFDAKQDQEFSLLNVIADIRAAIGDPEGKIMLGDLAAHIQRDIGELIESLGVEKRVSGSAISAVAHICEHLGCDDHNGHVPALRAIDALRSQINSLTTDVTNTRRSLSDAVNEADRMRMELAIERLAREALQEQLNAAPDQAPKGYVLKTPKRAMRSFGKEAAAQSAAMAAARAGKTGEVFALVPVGKAVRGAEWRAAEGAAK